MLGCQRAMISAVAGYLATTSVMPRMLPIGTRIMCIMGNRKMSEINWLPFQCTCPLHYEACVCVDRPCVPDLYPLPARALKTGPGSETAEIAASPPSNFSWKKFS